MRPRAAGLTVFVALATPGLLLSARAAPLAPEQCAMLTAQIEKLDQAGVKGILEKGVAAARPGLSREQREQVRVYLDALGQLRFRCPSEAPFVTLRQEAPDDPAEATALSAPIEAGAAGITLPPGVAAAVVAPVLPKKPVVAKAVKLAAPKPDKAAVAKADKAPPAKAKAAAGPAAPETAGGKAKTVSAPLPASPVAVAAEPAPAKAKAAVKAKSDDAYRPPAAQGKPN